MTAACDCVGQYTECITQKKYTPCKPVMLVRMQNPPQQEPSQQAVNGRLLFPESGGICRSHISRRVLDFSEVLIQLLNHQIIPLFFSPRTRSQVMFACATAGWHNIAVWFAPVFCFRFFVCNSSHFRLFCLL